MKNKKSFEYILGIILLGIGIFLLLSNTRVYSMGFYSFGRINTGGILLILMIIGIIAVVLKPNKITKGILASIFVLLILSLILGMRIGFYGMSIFDMILILLTLGIGIGLLIKNIIKK